MKASYSRMQPAYDGKMPVTSRLHASLVGARLYRTNTYTSVDKVGRISTSVSIPTNTNTNNYINVRSKADK